MSGARFLSDSAPGDLVPRLEAIEGRRAIIAIAGAPGSGKSTFADRLAGELNAGLDGCAAVLPMDGFHLDDSILDARGMRARKGAPDTFDVAGLDAALARLKANDAPEIFVPVFDRSVELSRASARAIGRDVRFVLVEGNYLICGAAPWNALRRHFDLSVVLKVPQEVLTARLEARWRGLGLSPSEIAVKVQTNDLPNGRFVTENSVGPDIVVHHAAELMERLP